MNIGKLIERNQCAITGIKDLEPLHQINDFPVFMGCINSQISQDLVTDMCWSISRGSGLIQLSKLIPLETLYPESHGSGGVGRLWEMHHKAFADFINKNALPIAVLEVGGAHGILSREYKQYNNIPWTILEPNPLPVEGCDAKFIKGFFDENFKCEDQFDTIVHSHVFEHIYNPDEFMMNLSGNMKAGDKLLFSIPNMQEMLIRNYTNCINFEHTIFLTEPYIEYLLAKHGYKLLNKKYFMEDHSIFYFAIRDLDVKEIPLPKGLYEKNKNIYYDYVDYHKELIAKLNKEINKANRPVYLFGAHVFSQYLIKAGLQVDKILFILDNDTKKQGRRLYGTSINVASPKILIGVANPIVIIKAGFYNNEIKAEILENINDSTQFL